MLRSINPFNNTEIKSYTEHTAEETAGIIQKTHDAFLWWKETGFNLRSEKMKKAASVLRENKEKYALLMTEEMGKPIAQARAEVEKCAWVCDYYADALSLS